jgi:hypothetical protein
VNDPHWCQSSKPILIVFNYRPVAGPTVVELAVEKARDNVPQTYHDQGSTAQVGKPALVSPCTIQKSCGTITSKNKAAALDQLILITDHQNCIHGNKENSQPAQISPGPVKMTPVTSMKKYEVEKKSVLADAVPLTDQFVEGFLVDSPLSKLVKCLDFKRKSRSGSNSSRLFFTASAEATDPNRALAQTFLTSVFHNSESFIQWTLNPDSDNLDQTTFFVQAETNQGLVEVLALAHVKFYSGRGILVRWLAVTGKKILTSEYGGNQDTNGSSWHNQGLSTLLLAIAQQVGKKLFKIEVPKMFAEVPADDVDAQAFYKKKGFMKVNHFPTYVEKDLHSHYESHQAQHGCTALGEKEHALHTMELNQWLGKVGDLP